MSPLDLKLVGLAFRALDERRDPPNLRRYPSLPAADDRDDELRERLRLEAQDEPRYGANTWQDRDADAAGVPLYGEI